MQAIGLLFLVGVLIGISYAVSQAFKEGKHGAIALITIVLFIIVLIGLLASGA